MSCDACTELAIPEHLCSFNKERDVPFEENEILYRRINSDIPDDIGLFSKQNLDKVFPLRNDSYNRSKFSNPQDVLIDANGTVYPEDKVISLKINLINSIEKTVPDSKNSERVFKLQVVSEIVDCNYAHCEVKCFMNGELVPNPEGNPKSSRSFMRDQLKRLIEFE